MANDVTLQSLIDELERGCRYHISVLFFGRWGTGPARLDPLHTIHAAPFCDAVKLRTGGLRRCLRCKALATEKARRTGRAFGGYCINGVYEYCLPVLRGGSPMAVVFVGNLATDPDRICRKTGLSPDDPLFETLERDLTPADCPRIGAIVASFLETLPEPAARPPEALSAAVAALKEYADAYYGQDLSLTALARLYHYNEKYLGRLFRQQMGLSFHAYLNARRLRQAAALLESTNRTVTDIAAAAGFNTVTYFNRQFRSYYGISPTEYRKKAPD